MLSVNKDRRSTVSYLKLEMHKVNLRASIETLPIAVFDTKIP